MKKLNLFGSRIFAHLSILSAFAFVSFHAVAADNVDVVAVRAKHEAMIQKIKGVRMTSISICDPQTGNRAKQREGSEVCVMVGFDFLKSLQNVQSVFEMPLRIEGALYGFEVIGNSPVRPQ